MDPKQQNTQSNEPSQQSGQIFGPSAADVESQTLATPEPSAIPVSSQPSQVAPPIAPAHTADSSDWLASFTQPATNTSTGPGPTPTAPADQVTPPELASPPTPISPPYSPPPVATHQTSAMHAKSSKAPLFIVIVLLVIVVGVGMAIALHKKTPQKTVTTKTTDSSNKAPASTPTTKTPNPTTPAATITATPQELATEFVRAVQGGNKTLADNLLSPKFKAALKEVTKSESFYDYCKADQFCDSLKWVTLDKAAVSVSDDKLEDGSAVKDVLFGISLTSSNSKSTSNLDVYLSANSKSWLIEDVEQSFGVEANQQKTTFKSFSKP